MGALLLLLAICACTPDVLIRPAGDAAWFELRLGGARVGAEQRVLVSDGAWRQSRYLWLLDGEEHAVVSTRRVRLDDAGQVVRWVGRRQGEPLREWTGAAWLPDLAVQHGQLPTGVLQILDTATLEVRQVPVTQRDGAWHWQWAGSSVEGRRDGSIRQGGLSLLPLAAEPTLRPVDPVALIRRPSRAIDNARSLKRARFRLDGREVIVDVPLDMELPVEVHKRLADLVATVRSQLVHAPAPGTPNALAALQSGRGDCNEFAAVFVALALSAGMDARPVSGVVYTDDGPEGPGLDLHAWAEVDLGDLGWIGVDPALGQPLADATHLVLARGRDLEGALLFLTGGADVEIIQTR
jgi:hypothetical protein